MPDDIDQWVRNNKKRIAREFVRRTELSRSENPVGIITAGLNLSMGQGAFSLIYLGFGIALSLLAFWAALRVRQTYDASMLNWQLKRRTRGSSGVLDKLDKLEKPDLGEK